MPRFETVLRSEFVRCLREGGFEGPFLEGRHYFMLRGEHVFCIPGKEETEIGPQYLARLLRHAGLDLDEWEVL